MIIGALALAGSGPVTAQTQQDVDEARRQREEVREDAADVAGRIDVLNGKADDLTSQLDVLELTISVIDSRLETAERAVESTESDMALANAEIAALKDQQDELRGALLEGVVDHYIDGLEANQGTILTADDPVDWSMQQGLVEFVSRDIAALQDQLRVVEARLEEAHGRAADLAADAATERDEAAGLAGDAEEAHQSQAEVLSKVSERLDHRLAEAEALASIDQELSDEIRRGEEEIARRVALASAKARANDAQSGGDTSDTGGGPSAKDNIARPEEIVNVQGIEIHRSVADQFRNMINAAEGAGIVISGSGWRSTEYQIQLRIQNCGATDYLIYDAPSEACWPPTARPASSNHEAGVAVDLTANGRAIVDRNSVAFQWLAANAATYGFYNLWSEPWHWSIDGR